MLSYPEQIFFLTFDEIEATAKQTETMQQLAAQRQEEFEINKNRPWPNVIHGKEEIYTDGAELKQDDEGHLIGAADSPGKVTGRACVIREPEEFHHFKKVISWLPRSPIRSGCRSFAFAGGVVTEVGGILSHGAIVARKYGIPAVMSINSVTQYVLEGQTITVDGDKGRVFVRIGAA